MTGQRDRGQVFTLEALTASVILLGSIAFALQTAGVTPLTTGTTDHQVIDRQAELAQSGLDAAVANDTLRATVLYWNDSSGRFHGSGEDGYYEHAPPTALGAVLNRTYDARGVAFNLYVTYAANGTTHRETLVRQGTPGSHATSAARTVTLTDTDDLRAADGAPTNTSLAAATTFYAPDAAPGGPLYNVVRVEVVLWQV